MAEGLRLLSTCPRCGTGALVFRDADKTTSTSTAKEDERAPHLVLGVPRR
jgi:hypothetical protein